MKITYEFDLEDQEDVLNYERIKQWENVYAAMFQITHNLKKKLLSQEENDDRREGIHNTFSAISNIL